MAYSVFLYEQLETNDNWIELDVEDVDFSTVFSVSDVKDINSRKDNYTKYLSLKGTPRNNQAFGTMFHLNMVSDFNFDNRILFNYNPLRSVKCLVYEDSALILVGSMVITNIKVNQGNVTYTALINGSFIDFKDTLSDKMLTDLDFSNLAHRLNWDNVSLSWSQRTERFDSEDNSFYVMPFEKGQGYVYPFIDYGHIFKNPSSNTDLNNVHSLNFRPAIYVREYMDRIITQPELVGYSYEVKGDEEFIKKFDSLIIPNADEKMKYNLNGFNLQFSKALIAIENQVGFQNDQYNLFKLLQFNFTPTYPPGVSSIVSREPFSTTVLKVDRTFTSDAQATVTFNMIRNQEVVPGKMSIQLLQRPAEANSSSTSGWELITESTTINVNPGAILTDKTIVLNIGEREFTKGMQLGLRVVAHTDVRVFVFPAGYVGPKKISWDISATVLSFPKNTSTPFSVDMTFDSGEDIITPTAPANIKQIDFIKSIITQFNFYVYTTKERPKHLIFERYNDYYALANLKHLKTNALDWTGKLDYSDGLSIKSNLEIPKKYLFTYKDDSDFINGEYKRSFSEPYGSFAFTDNYGTTDQKKVELIFSPSPMVKYLGTNRIHPAIYQVSDAQKKLFKSNIRLMYYNGLKNCLMWKVGRDNGDTADITIKDEITQYPQAGNYYLEDGISMTAKNDLNFSLAKQIYFDGIVGLNNCPTAYSNYYQSQTTDLTNPNVSYIEVSAHLNELDIANLNLKIPVFIDMGELGHSYFKILSVDYKSNTSTSKCLLQKIVI